MILCYVLSTRHDPKWWSHAVTLSPLHGPSRQACSSLYLSRAEPWSLHSDPVSPQPSVFRTENRGSFAAVFAVAGANPHWSQGPHRWCPESPAGKRVLCILHGWIVALWPVVWRAFFPSLLFEMAGGRPGLWKREMGRSCAELKTTGKEIMWRHFTHCSFHLVPGLLYKAVPPEPPGRGLEALPEPAAGVSGPHHSWAHVTVTIQIF